MDKHRRHCALLAPKTFFAPFTEAKLKLTLEERATFDTSHKVVRTLEKERSTRKLTDAEHTDLIGAKASVNALRDRLRKRLKNK